MRARRGGARAGAGAGRRRATSAGRRGEVVDDRQDRRRRDAAQLVAPAAPASVAAESVASAVAACRARRARRGVEPERGLRVAACRGPCRRGDRRPGRRPGAAWCRRSRMLRHRTLAARELGQQLGRSARRRRPGSAQPVRSTCSASSTSTISSPPSRRDGHGRVAAAQHVGDRRAAGARCPRRCVSPTPRSKIRARMRSGPELAPERDVGAVAGTPASCSIAGPIAGEVERLELVGVGDADRALRVADLDVLEAPARRRRRARRGRRRAAGEVGRRSRARPMSTRQVALVVDRRADLAGGGLDRELRRRRSSRARRRYRIASRAPLPDSSASRAVGVEDPQRARRSPARRAARARGRRRRRCPMWRSQSRRDARRRSARTAARRARRSGSRCPAPATSRSASARASLCAAAARPRRRRASRPVTSTCSTPGELAQPRQLALGVAARAALHRLDVAVEQLVEARAPCGRSPRRRPRRRARTSSAAPAATIASTRASMRAYERRRAPSSGRPAASGGACRAVHSCGSPARRGARSPSSSSSSARTIAVAVGAGRSAAAAAGARAASSACSAAAPALAGSATQPLAHAGGGGGRRSSSASAARRYRPVPPTTIGGAPCGEQRRRSRRGRARRTAPARKRLGRPAGTTTSRCSSRALLRGVGDAR